MNALMLTAVIVGHLTVTSYQPIREQTDSTPFYTSTGEHVRAGGCAVSRDLLCPSCMKLHRRCKRANNLTKLHYGDWLYVERYGFRQVNDVMGEYTTQRIKGKITRIPIRRHVDIFVWDYEQEKKVGVRKLTVHRVKEEFIPPPIENGTFDGETTGTIKGGRSVTHK